MWNTKKIAIILILCFCTLSYGKRLKSGQLEIASHLHETTVFDSSYDVVPTEKDISFDALRPQIREFYLKYLGREPDQPGMNFWLLSVEMSKLSLDKVSFYIRNSNEAKIRQYFLKYLGREPDQAGAEEWISDDTRTKQELLALEIELRSSSSCIYKCL